MNIRLIDTLFSEFGNGGDFSAIAIYITQANGLVTQKKTENWVKLNRSVWQRVDKNESLATSIKLIDLQLDELESHIANGADKLKIVNEFCDIVSICVRRVENMGYDFEVAMLQRIHTRYEGKIAEICEKYKGLI